MPLEVLASIAAAASLEALAAVSIRDQRGREDSLGAHRGRPVVAFVVTAKRLRSIRAWEEALRARYDVPTYLHVADVPESPPAKYESVASKLRGRVPEEVSILIDMERTWAKTLALDTAETNALVFDGAGALAGQVRGKPTPGALVHIAKALEGAGLVRKPPPSKGAR